MTSRLLNFLFDSFSFILFALNHVDNSRGNSDVIKASFKSFCRTIHMASSASKSSMMGNLLDMLNISLIYMVNNTGPKMDPCDILHHTELECIDFNYMLSIYWLCLVGKYSLVLHFVVKHCASPRFNKRHGSMLFLPYMHIRM